MVKAPALIQHATSSAKEVEENETLLVEDGQFPQSEEDLNRQRTKQRLVEEQTLRLQEEERQAIYRQDLV